MKMEEIFTNDAWDDVSQKLFWSTWKKKRNNKLHFIKTKAFVFLDKPSDGEKQKGIDILTQTMMDYISNKTTILSKEKYPHLYKEEIIRLAILLAEILFKLNHVQQAMDVLNVAEKDIFTQEPHEHWNCQTYFFHEAYILCAEIAIQDNNAELAKHYILKAKQLEENAFMRYLEIETKLAYLTLDFSETDKKWSDWYDLETFPFEKLKQLEYIGAVNGIPSLDFEDAAETFIVNHNSVLSGKNIPSLKSLDQALKSKKYDIERLDKTYLRERYVAELGAYIAEIFNQELKAKWIPGNTMTSSTIQIENLLISPFKMAYDVVYLKRRIIEDVIEKKENYCVY